MLFTITTPHSPVTDLGYLLAKNPSRFQIFSVSFGQTHVFYPVAEEDRCTAALLLDIDPIGLVRRPGKRKGVSPNYLWSQVHSLRSSRTPSSSLREFALGLEAPHRFVDGEPLYRVHQCVFGVLAPESEPVDPRLQKDWLILRFLVALLIRSTNQRQQNCPSIPRNERVLISMMKSLMV